MKSSLVDLVWSRAKRRCEYCRLHQSDNEAPFHLEYIIAKQHGGVTEPGNLCLACPRCNSFKVPNVAGRHRGRTVPLFHPRTQVWSDHFHWEQTILVGETPVGIVTVHVLNINEEVRVLQRELMLFEGRFPPDDDCVTGR